MKYHKNILLKDNRECLLREGRKEDGAAVFELFNVTHAQTDYLRSYPDENSMDAEQESKFLQEKSGSAREIEMVAVVENAVVGMAAMENKTVRQTGDIKGSAFLLNFVLAFLVR